MRPSLDNRKSHLINNNQSSMIVYKSFVTNKHILVQFKFYKTHPKDANTNGSSNRSPRAESKLQTVVFDQKGSIIPQSREA